jgi:hypothetical protein
MEVVIRQNYNEMSKLAAQMVAELLNTKPNAVLGMATGSTPLGLYQELVRMYQRGQLDFSRVLTFNLLDSLSGRTVWCQTGTAVKPQQKHKCQAKRRPQNVQDDIVDVCSSIDPCPRKVLNEFDAG